MMAYALISKTVLGLLLCCGASQLSMAQRVAIEPLTPFRPRVKVQPRSVQAPSPNAGAQAPNQESAKPILAPTTAQTSAPQPLFLLDAALIIAPDLAGFQPTDIQKLIVYKGKDAPLQWRNLATNGIIDITLKQKKKLKSRSLADLGKRLGLTGPICYTVNGMPGAEPSLRIAVDAIGEIKVLRADSIGGVTTLAINVRPPKPSPLVPPGTIRIRGLALQ